MSAVAELFLFGVLTAVDLDAASVQNNRGLDVPKRFVRCISTLLRRTSERRSSAGCLAFTVLCCLKANICREMR